MNKPSKSRNVQDIYPLSLTQEGILFHTLYEAQPGAYLDQLIFTIEGPLDAEAFRRAWQAVVDHHPVLRTIFLWENRNKPLQVVRRSAPVEMTIQDRRRDTEAGLDGYLREDRRRGFNLQAAPLMRLALLRTGEAVHEFVWTYHYLILDGWCLPLLLRDFLAAYEALSAGRPVALPQVPPYRDYIAWLRRQDLSAAEDYWRRYLDGFKAPTPLPPDPALAPAEGFGHRTLRLSRETSRGLEALARANRLTPNTIFQGAWAILLARYSGESDVLFGATVSGRPADLPQVESVVGVFINTLPVRARVDPERSLVDWLADLQAGQAPQRSLEHSPLIEVQGWSAVPRGQPLFETILVFSNYPRDVPFLEGIDSSLRMGNFRALEQNNYPLSLLVAPGERWQLWVDYDRGRISDAAVERLIGHLETILRSLPDRPHVQLASLPWLTDGERVKILEGWNATREAFDPREFVHTHFESQAARSPDRLAVTAGTERLTYGRLARKAGSLAARLRSLGAGPETLVALCTERGATMLIGLLGILKTGAAYVPVDPDYPPARIAHILSDSAAPIVLADRPRAEALAPLLSELARVLLVEEAASPEAESPEPADLSPENLAYVIHTSGSTGLPKGVQVPHRALANFLHSMRNDAGLTAADRLLAVTTLSFDIAALELFLPLVIGAQVVIAALETSTDAQQLAQALEDHEISAMQATPATWRMLVDSGWQGTPGLKVLCGGEALPRDLAGELLARGASLVNLYGPTETTIWSASQPVTSAGGSIPIGRPIGNTQFYILDRQMQPVPAGVAGDLYIGGEGLARGYLNRPGQTADRFVPNPFAGLDGYSRLYRTGDLARWLPDGRVDFLGRSDFQVKIRGFRVELEEIETALRAHPDIGGAVALVRKDGPGDQRLVAYLVAERSRPTVEELRRHLAGTLPDYMLPGHFVHLNAFPLTPNGKIDRNALPAPGETRPELAVEFVPAANDLEKKVAAIWQEVLQLERVGVHDNFFDLGGHSLLMVQVFGKLRSTLDSSLSMVELFRFPTVRAMAESLGAESPPSDRLDASAERAARRRAALARKRRSRN